jgi:hypothetical protein
MCKNAYIRPFNKNGQEMIFCHLFDDKNDEALRLCNFEKYCNLDGKYIFEKPERCRFYSEG